MTITGKIVYQNLSGGFWGIEGDDGEQYRPDDMPSALQKEGLRVRVSLKESGGGMSVFMWGKSVRIQSYEKI